MGTNRDLDVEQPKGYGIVNPETGKVRLIWKILSVIAFCLIVRLMIKKSISSDMIAYFWIFWLSANFFLVCVKIVIERKVVRYRVERDLRMSIYRKEAGIRMAFSLKDRKMRNAAHLRVSSALGGAFKEAKEAILQNEDLGRARKQREKIESFESLVETNKAFPECQGSLFCKCKKGECVLHFESSVEFYEQKSRDGFKHWEKSDGGRLQVTNRRIIFAGSNQNRELSLNDIVSVDATENAITFSASNRVRPIRFKSLDGWRVAIIIKLSKANPEWKVIPRESMVDPSMESLDCDVSAEMLCAMNQTATAFANIVKEMAADDRIVKTLQNYTALENEDEVSWFVFDDSKIGFVAVADLFVSFVKLGHSVNDLSSPEGLGLLIALSKLFICDREISISEWKEKSFRQGVEALLVPYIEKINDILPFCRQDNALYATDVVSESEYSLANGYVSALYKWAIQIVGADNEVSTSENRWLGVLKCYSTLKGRIGDKATMISLQEINSIKCD